MNKVFNEFILLLIAQIFIGVVVWGLHTYVSDLIIMGVVGLAVALIVTNSLKFHKNAGTISFLTGTLITIAIVVLMIPQEAHLLTEGTGIALTVGVVIFTFIAARLSIRRQPLTEQEGA